MAAGSADGMAVDEEGGVLVATGEGGRIARFEADGTPVGALDVPASFVSSLCFGGEDMRDVFVTTGDGKLLRGRADVPGLPVRPAAI
jgi:gluconolactonase